MRKSLTKLSSVLLFFIFSGSLLAKPVAQVVEVSGPAFVVNKDGATKTLKKNQHIEEISEILVGDDGAVTLNDYYSCTYNLIAGSHIKFFNKSVQLKKGKAWIKSKSGSNSLSLTTANGQVDFSQGEFIVTFDQSTNQTQLFVVNGEMDVSNVLNKDIKYSVPGGSFTTIDPETNNGVPRTPTKVGVQSLTMALSDFKKIPSIEIIEKASQRGLASIKEEKLEDKPTIKKGEIIYLTTHRKPASIEQGEAHNYYKKIINKKNASTKIKIKIYGTSWKKEQPKLKTFIRTPASIKIIEPIKIQKSSTVVADDAEFQRSLKKHEAEQPKYSKELNNLIEELKSY
jgi:hypothetical protein